jgi:transmembrane sensor
MSHVRSSDRLKAEAAAWLARIHSDDGEAFRPALDAWLAEDPAHAAAFAHAQEVWAILPRATAQLEPRAPTAAARSVRHVPARAVVAALAACFVVGLAGVAWLLQSQDAYVTRPGEQKVAMLEDGSRIALNTDTRLGVRFEEGRRHVTLDRGEAMFEVASDAGRPFVVIAGDTRVQAIGTTFIVKRTADDVSVILIEGRVAVTHDRSAETGRAARPVMLGPGEKLIEPAGGPIWVEPTSIDAATAWRRGQTVFDDTPLGAAVAELNRYGGPTIVIEDPRIAALPISGVYATNAADFAEAAAALHGLKLEREGEDLYIRR